MNKSYTQGYNIGIITKYLSDKELVLSTIKAISTTEDLLEKFLSIIEQADRQQIAHNFNAEIQSFFETLKTMRRVNVNEVMRGISDAMQDDAII